MTGLAGTGVLVRGILRRDRMRMLVWVGGIVAMTASSAAGVKGIFPTAADLQRAAALVEGNAVAIAFNGPFQGLETIGGRIAFETGAFTLVLVGLMSLFTVSRNTRAEEESGRLELIRATAVGRHAPAAAALAVVAGMNVVTGLGVTVALLGLDLPAAGCVAYGVSAIAVGFVFASVTAVAAQVTENTRVVSGLAGIAVGGSYSLRAVGDIGDGTLSWLSPIGWGQKLRPFASEQWWPLVVPVAVVAGGLWLAGTLASHRDLGGGLVPPRAGPATAPPSLGRPLGLAVRLQRGAAIAWGSGVLALGLVYGSVADQADKLLEDLDESVRDMLAQSGGDFVDSFLGTTLLILALIGSGFAVQAALRLRSEESGLRAEPVLATPTSRRRWAASHIAAAVGGGAAVLAAGGFGLGLAYGLAAGDIGELFPLLASALSYLPATGVLIGLAVALFGLAPRAGRAVWGVLAVCFVIGFFGELLDLPNWLTNLSPFEHTPLVPAEDPDVLPLLVQSAVAVMLAATGMAAFHARDIG
ncbi:MAG TPA: ABC transporter permease [Acidimicrobiia bacterium]